MGVFGRRRRWVAALLQSFLGGLLHRLFSDYHFFFRVLLEFFFGFLLEFFFLESLQCCFTAATVASIPSEPVVHGHQLGCVFESLPVRLVRDHNRDLLQFRALFWVYLLRLLLPVQSLDQSLPIPFILLHQLCIVYLHLPTQFWAALVNESVPVFFVEPVLVEVFFLHWVILVHLLLDADHSLQYH